MKIRHFLAIAMLLFFSSLNAAPVNINLANADTIAKSLNGIGPSKAAAIVQFRNANGPFKSIEELKYVKGIGAKTLSKIRNDLILVSETD